MGAPYRSLEQKAEAAIKAVIEALSTGMAADDVTITPNIELASKRWTVTSSSAITPPRDIKRGLGPEDALPRVPGHRDPDELAVGVEQGDAQIQRSVDHRARALLVEPDAEIVAADADGGDAQAGAAEIANLHKERSCSGDVTEGAAFWRARESVASCDPVRPAMAGNSGTARE